MRQQIPVGRRGRAAIAPSFPAAPRRDRTAPHRPRGTSPGARHPRGRARPPPAAHPPPCRGWVPRGFAPQERVGFGTGVPLGPGRGCPGGRCPVSARVAAPPGKGLVGTVKVSRSRQVGLAPCWGLGGCKGGPARWCRDAGSPPCPPPMSPRVPPFGTRAAIPSAALRCVSAGEHSL